MFRLDKSSVKRIQLEGFQMDYVVERRDVRNARIEFKTDGFHVILPRNIRDETDLIKKSKEWIIKAYRRYESQRNSYPHMDDKFPVFGEDYTIIVDEGFRCFEVDPDQKLIRVRSLEALKPFKAYLKRILMDKLAAIIGGLPAGIDKRYNKIYIRNQRRRWASCSSDRNLSFNLKMASLPENLIEYVVYHELMHFRVKRHNSDFYRLISERYGDYRSIRKKLNSYFIGLSGNRFWRILGL